MNAGHHWDRPQAWRRPPRLAHPRSTGQDRRPSCPCISEISRATTLVAQDGSAPGAEVIVGARGARLKISGRPGLPQSPRRLAARFGGTWTPKKEHPLRRVLPGLTRAWIPEIRRWGRGAFCDGLGCGGERTFFYPAPNLGHPRASTRRRILLFQAEGVDVGAGAEGLPVARKVERLPPLACSC